MGHILLTDLKKQRLVESVLFVNPNPRSAYYSDNKGGFRLMYGKKAKSQDMNFRIDILLSESKKKRVVNTEASIE